MKLEQMFWYNRVITHLSMRITSPASISVYPIQEMGVRRWFFLRTPICLLFPPSQNFWEGGTKGGWVSNYISEMEQDHISQ